MIKLEELSYIVHRISALTPDLVANALSTNIRYLSLNGRIIDTESNPTIIVTKVYPDGVEEFFAAISVDIIPQEKRYSYGIYGRPEIREKQPYAYAGVVNRLDYTLRNSK